MKEYNINVEGMHCTGCGNRIINALKEVEGVIEVKADYTKGIVHVKGKEEIEEALYETLEDIGFPVIKEK